MSSPALRRQVDVALLALLALAIVASAADLAGVRAGAVLAAMLLVPGGALLTRIDVDETLAAIGIAIGLSLAIDTLLATFAAVTHFWHPEVLALALGAAAATLLLSDLRGLGSTRAAAA